MSVMCASPYISYTFLSRRSVIPGLLPCVRKHKHMVVVRRRMRGFQRPAARVRVIGGLPPQIRSVCPTALYPSGSFVAAVLRPIALTYEALGRGPSALSDLLRYAYRSNIGRAKFAQRFRASLIVARTFPPAK